MASTLQTSTTGNQQQLSDDLEPIEAVADRVLRRIEYGSVHFDQVQPYAYPSFEVSEVELGNTLGFGEFGVVYSVNHLHVAEECPCKACRNRRSDPDLKQNQQDGNDRTTQDERVEIFVDSAPNTGGASLDQQLPQVTEGATAEDGKVPDDDSTLSTDEEDRSSPEANETQDEDSDGEVHYLREYMSKHVRRHGYNRYAVKKLRHDTPDRRQAAVDLAVEAKFLATLQHPNIVKMRGTIGRPGSFDFMIIMDRLTFTLREKIAHWNDELKGKRNILDRFLHQSKKGRRAMIEDQFADKLLAVFDLARAMRYLHNHMILFRDLKPENIAVDVRGEMRVFDFGLAKELKSRDLVEPPDGFVATGMTGSRSYMAPEVVSCKHYGLKADVYSYAIIFWEVFSGQEAFQKMSRDKHFERVVRKGKRPGLRAVNATRPLSKELLSMLESMWSATPADRPKFMKICDTLAYDDVLSKNQDGRKISDRSRHLMNMSLRSRENTVHSAASSSKLTESGHGSSNVPPKRGALSS